MERIKRNSRIITILAKLGIYLVILGLIMFIYIVIEAPAGSIIKLYSMDIPTSNLSNMDRAAIILIGILMGGTYLMALIYLKKLFTLYEKGIIFDDRNAKYMNGFAYSVIIYSIIKSFSGLVLPIHRIFRPDIKTFIIGVVFLVISMVIDEGRKIKQEHDLTV